MYETLTVYGYKNFKDVENEYMRRLNSPSSVRTNLLISPFSQQKEVRLGQKYPLFYMTTPDHLKLIETIINNSKEILLASENLPNGVLDHLRTAQLINEIKSTNDIEGVKSTKKEINEAISAQNTEEDVRFKRTVKMYMNILQSEKLTISTLQDFRDIYEEVVSDEISEEDQVDGLLFRKEPVNIFDQRNNKVVHRGNPSEASIQEDLLNLIAFMNEKEHSFIIKSIVTHYFFEYIHPFYDGNGRLGRFILTSYLGNKLDTFSALSISESIFNSKKKYEDAFIEVSSPKNYGDITHFITSMLKIIVTGQRNIITEIKSAQIKMIKLMEYIKSSNFSKNQKKILLIMLQIHLFDSSNEYIENQELDGILKNEISRPNIDKTLKELEAQSLVIKVKSRPIAYVVNEDAIPDFE